MVYFFCFHLSLLSDVFLLWAGDNGSRSDLQMKLIQTAVGGAAQPADLSAGEVGISKDALLLYCSDGSVLKVCTYAVCAV